MLLLCCDPDNTAIYVILCLYFGVLVIATANAFLINNTRIRINLGFCQVMGDKVHDMTQGYFGAGTGFGTLVWFFTMCATLFSGNSLSAVANEAHTRGFQALRWICAGVPIYGCYLLLAPRLHALGKSRGYITPQEFFYDRFAITCHPIIPHCIRILSLLACQLPIFCYLINQFTAIGTEIEAFTKGEISRLGALFTAAVVLVVLSILGGLRGVAYTDVIQGFALLVGSLTFFCVQHTELGGMGAMSAYTRSQKFMDLKPPFSMYANYNNVPVADGPWSTTAYASFIIKITIAGTMLPHLIQRLFMGRSSVAIRRGMTVMPWMFFFIQFSSCMCGWIATRIFAPKVLNQGVYGAVASVVRTTGTSGQFAAALLISAAICAMMSTADSALISFSAMWTKDFFNPYIKPGAPQWVQLLFGKIMGIIGLGIGLLLASKSLQEPDVWNLSTLFSIQAVTVMHIAPAMWLGLHWKGLRGEAVLAGMVVGLGIMVGLVAAPSVNTKLAVGAEEYKNGWSLSLIALCFNLIITVVFGLILEWFPKLLPVSSRIPAYARPLDLEEVFGKKLDKCINPWYWLVWVIFFMFQIPFYRQDFGQPDKFVEFMPSWAFISIIFAAALAIWVGVGFRFFWQDYDLPMVPSLFPIHPADLARMEAEKLRFGETALQEVSTDAKQVDEFPSNGANMDPTMHIVPQPMGNGNGLYGSGNGSNGLYGSGNGSNGLYGSGNGNHMYPQVDNRVPFGQQAPFAQYQPMPTGTPYTVAPQPPQMSLQMPGGSPAPYVQVGNAPAPAPYVQYSTSAAPTQYPAAPAPYSQYSAAPAPYPQYSNISPPKATAY